MSKSKKVDIVALGFEQVGSSLGNVTEYRLKSNGLRVILMEDHSAPVATVVQHIRVGSRNEAVGTTGSTHLLEHMMFKGTWAFNKRKGNSLDRLFAQAGACVNANTWDDRTMYHEQISVSYLELSLRIEADRLRNLQLRQEDYDSEMRVVRQEMDQGENRPWSVLWKQLNAVAYQEHPYRNPTIGYQSDVEGVAMSRLKGFYDTYYWPNNASLVIGGDLDLLDTLRLVAKHYGAIPASPHPIPKVYTVEPKQEGERRFKIHRPTELSYLAIAFHIPEAIHQDQYSLDMAAKILGGSEAKTSWLYKALVETDLASMVSVDVAKHHDPGLFMVFAQPNPKVNPAQVENVIYEQLVRLGREPIDYNELAQFRQSNRRATDMARATPSKIAFALAEAESHAGWRWEMEYDANFDQVTAGDVMRVAGQYFKENNRTVGLYLPSALAVELPADSNSAAKVVATQEPVSKKGQPKVRKPRVPKPAEGKLDIVTATLARYHRKASQASTRYAKAVVRTTLDNGLAVLVLPQRNGSGAVSLNVKIKAGNYYEPRALGNLADIVSGTLCGGTVNYSSAQIADMLNTMGLSNGLSSRLQVTPWFFQLAATVSASDLSAFVQLSSDILRNPSFAPGELAIQKAKWLASYQQSKQQPSSIAWQNFARLLYPEGHLYHEKTYDDLVADLNLMTNDDVRAFHQASFVPAGTIITVVGDIEAPQAIAEIAQAFSGWETGDSTRKDLVVPSVALPTPNTVAATVPGKQTIDIRMGHPVKRLWLDDTAEYVAAYVGNSILGGDTLIGRLGSLIREQNGLTYGVYSSFYDPTRDDRPWFISMSVDPSKADLAIKMAKDVVTHFVNDGITEVELKREAGRFAGSFPLMMGSQLAIASQISACEFSGLGLEALDAYVANVERLTVEDVNNAIRKHLHPNHLVISKAGAV